MHLLISLLSFIYVGVAAALWVFVVVYECILPMADRYTFWERLTVALVICIWPIYLTVWLIVRMFTQDVNRW